MDLSITTETLALLRCPRTKQPLHVADADEFTRWTTLDQKAEGFLVTEDGSVAYPIDDGFPVILLERALEYDASSGPVA